MENDTDLKILQEARDKYEKARSILYKIADEKFKDKSTYYYIKNKNIGSRSIQQLKDQRDSLHIETLINLLKKME